MMASHAYCHVVNVEKKSYLILGLYYTLLFAINLEK